MSSELGPACVPDVQCLVGKPTGNARAVRLRCPSVIRMTHQPYEIVNRPHGPIPSRAFGLGCLGGQGGCSPCRRGTGGASGADITGARVPFEVLGPSRASEENAKGARGL